SPFVQQNIEKLKSFGYQFIGPQIGDLACGSKGRGRIADIEDIVEKMEDIFTKKDLKGYKFIITSGPTHEAIDPVRYITNRSTGKMGYALAITAKRRGAEVILIAGQSYLPPPTNDMKVIRVFTAKEMRDKVIENFKWCDAVIKAAAVADFRPSTIQNEKIKKEGGKYFLELEKNPDILKELGEIKKEHQILVGFAAETSRHIDNAIKKLKEKKLDLIIANDVTLEGAGFGYDTNIVDIIDATGKVKSLPLMSKMEIANIILDQILRIFKKKGREKPWPQIW
ncbi:MAG: bifunctional phosphopantothenoylcysteine decarboxylase/phosphopantothenate--cysteine ligase CoaBC, partial [Deltaproteobacteria bacterium]|nr:bifunctional phosphopantothenoylcysteine decarboxylase/phosphopantothenate--cysteine ligase CoaBC [Deltaproteobacteria bacterium]